MSRARAQMVDRLRKEIASVVPLLEEIEEEVVVDKATHSPMRQNAKRAL